jgi:hypothetical protein
VPITETITDVNQIVIRTALMHRDQTAAQALDTAITENFPGTAVREVLMQAEINSINAARERQEIKDAERLVATYPDAQGRLFGDDDEPPSVFMPCVLGGKPYHKVSITAGLEWARGVLERRTVEVRAYEQSLLLAKGRMQSAHHEVTKHEAAVAWCVRHGLNPETVTYAEVRQRAEA